jgi:D-alanine-D-alanine ligase
VLGNDAPEASVVGELVPSHEFYDYADKYVDQGARITIPAALPAEIVDAMRALALQAFRAIDCSGLARVDFFLETATGRILVNEINTMPGFTSISMYPKLWAASGLPYPALLDRLIASRSSATRRAAKQRLSFSVPSRSSKPDAPPPSGRGRRAEQDDDRPVPGLAEPGRELSARDALEASRSAASGRSRPRW